MMGRRDKKVNTIQHFLMKNGDLVQYNSATGTHKKRNNIERIDTRITKKEFDENVLKQLKRFEFSRLMNVFFKDVVHTWRYENTNYGKGPNFEVNSMCGSCINYNVYKFPKHTEKNLILVYHWGKVYYSNISYNGYEQGILFDTKTLNQVRWAKLKHCAAVINLHTNKPV